MNQTALILIGLGGILLLGMATDLLGRRTALPRVTLLLGFGILLGDQVFGLIPHQITAQFELIASMALLMVGFLLGGKLTRKQLRHTGRCLLFISLGAVMATITLVALALAAMGIPWEVAVLLGCIASATAPAASIDIVEEQGARGPFARLLLAIVALDDVWALMVFSIGVAVVAAMSGDHNVASPLMHAVYDLGGAVVLGLVIGFPAAALTGRVRPGQPMLTEALGLVFLCGGIALWLEVSYLVAAIVMGAVIANFARHHDYPFHAIEDIEWPFMALFFILAGTALDLAALRDIGIIGVVYVAARIAGKWFGARIGAQLADASVCVRQHMGLALLPQAGAAMGMALVAANQFQEHRQLLLTVAISTTVIFELIGPLLTSRALTKAEAWERTHADSPSTD